MSRDVRPVMVVQHEPGEGLGALEPALRGAGLTTRLVRTWLGEPVPREPGDACAVIALGGGQSAVPPLAPAFLEDEVALLAAACARELPVLGLCLGSQLLAASLGAQVSRAPRRELGFLRVRLAAAAGDDPLFNGLPQSFVAFHWHDDTFSLPEGAVALASSTATPLQAFRRGTAWGLQFHPEVTRETLASMVGSAEAEVRKTGAEPDELLESGAREVPRMDGWRVPLFSRWAALAAREK